MSRRILAFEPFDAGSHRAVRESITRHSRHEWTWITRPGRGWKWRMRLAAIEMADEARATWPEAEPGPDAIVATSLLGPADLRAMLPAAWRATPFILYMHENQAAYPVGHALPGAAARDVHFALTNLTGLLAADRVLWNSRWNLDSFCAGLPGVLAHAPEPTGDGWVDRVRARSVVAWPPVEPPGPGDRPHRRAGGATRIVWPHRWEHDKGPEELLALAERYTACLDLRWTILGARFRTVPAALEAFLERFADRIDHAGFAESAEAYHAHLASADWVLSTARHEFFGVAVVEALLAGCLPWLPDRLSYPELLPAEARGLAPANPPEDPGSVRAAVIEHLAPARAEAAVARIDDEIESAIAAGPVP